MAQLDRETLEELHRRLSSRPASVTRALIDRLFEHIRDLEARNRELEILLTLERDARVQDAKSPF